MNPQSRMFSVSVRQGLLTMYTGGDTMGRESAQRALWEVGDCLADIHGRETAAAALYRVADTIATGGEVSKVWPVPEKASTLDELEDAIDRLAKVLPPAPEKPTPEQPFLYRYCVIVIFAAFWGGMVIGGVR